MGESTQIGWTDHTFNSHIGCQRVSPACGGAKGVGGCYAEALVTGRMGYNPTSADPRRRLTLWGPPSTSTRQRTSPTNWRNPVKWNAAAKAEGVRRRVFCASLADVFEDHPDLPAVRADLWPLIEACGSLDWQLLTKRPENILAMVPPAWLDVWPAHVWVGTTVEDQRRANERIPHLLAVPARVRFLSCEPMLEAIDLTRLDIFKGEGWTKSLPGEPATYYDALRGSGLRPSWTGVSIETTSSAIAWCIVGGESGPGARPFDLAWARSIVAQCDAAGIPVFVKQLGAQPVDSARAAIHQPCIHERRPSIRTTIYPADAPEVAQARIDERDQRLRLAAPQVEHPLHLRSHFRLDDRAGADPAQWPADLRRQSFPEVPRGG